MSENSEHKASEEKFHGEIKDYRQPLVTSLGIILGFLLNYLVGWANSSDGEMLQDNTDVTIFVTILAAVSIFIITMYRMLNPSVPAANPLGYYRTTLRLYVTGIVVAFAGIFIACVV